MSSFGIKKAQRITTANKIVALASSRSLCFFNFFSSDAMTAGLTDKLKLLRSSVVYRSRKWPEIVRPCIRFLAEPLFEVRRFDRLELRSQLPLRWSDRIEGPLLARSTVSVRKAPARPLIHRNALASAVSSAFRITKAKTVKRALCLVNHDLFLSKWRYWKGGSALKLSSPTKVFHASNIRNYACVVALLLAIQINPDVVEAAEPPSEHAYHVSVLTGSTIGSAFMIDAGLVVTNSHVVAGRRAGDRVLLLVPTGHRVVARIEAISSQMDLAVISVSGNLMPVVPRAPGLARRGAKIVAVGIEARSGNPRQRHVIRGVVVSNKRAVAPFGRGVIARMPSLKKGFSGGPVFDHSGRLVGMIAAVRQAHDSPSGRREAFIVSADEIRSEVARLIAH